MLKSVFVIIIKKIAEAGIRLMITSDHGTIKVTNPVRIVGEKSTNSNLRYKVGRGLNYNKKEVFSVQNPQEAFLPKLKMSSEFVFAKGQDFFVYPNNSIILLIITKTLFNMEEFQWKRF